MSLYARLSSTNAPTFFIHQNSPQARRVYLKTHSHRQLGQFGGCSTRRLRRLKIQLIASAKGVIAAKCLLGRPQQPRLATATWRQRGTMRHRVQRKAFAADSKKMRIILCARVGFLSDKTRPRTSRSERLGASDALSQSATSACIAFCNERLASAVRRAFDQQVDY